MRNVIAMAVVGGVSLAVGPAYAGDPIEVCIGDSGAMRVIESDSCRADEELKRFDEWEPEIDVPDPEDTEAKKTAELQAQVRELTARIAALESSQPREITARVAALESVQPAQRRSSATGNARVTAPFEVVGADGTVILRVAESVSSTDGDGAHVTIGPGAAGNFALRVYKDGGPFVAGIGQAQNGAGLAIVMDASGDIAANMSGDSRVSVYKDGVALAGLLAEDRGGTVAVFKDTTPIAYLTQSSGGDGGNVTTALNSGFGVFSAGAAQDGGGEACVNRVTGGGQQRSACIGIELPSMGLGK